MKKASEALSPRRRLARSIFNVAPRMVQCKSPPRESSDESTITRSRGGISMMAGIKAAGSGLSLGDLPQQQSRTRSEAARQSSKTSPSSPRERGSHRQRIPETEPLARSSAETSAREKRLLQGNDSLWRLRKKGRRYSDAGRMHDVPSAESERCAPSRTARRIASGCRNQHLASLDGRCNRQARVQLDMQNQMGCSPR
jgi:hypothetical protein